MKNIEKEMLRTWVEVDRKAIRENVKTFRSLISPNTKLMSVVKSNAYGHGLVDFSQEVVSAGVDFLGVDSLVEALALRKQGVKIPILVLGHTLPSRIAEAAKEEVSITVSDLESVKQIQKLHLKKKVRVHIKVDTGMHRQGFLPEERGALLRALKNTSLVEVEGLYTHFAAAKNPAFPAYTKKQIEVFRTWVDGFRTHGFAPITHSAATSGTILFPEAHFDMVRVGIGMYGLWPSKEVQAFCEGKISLKPVLSWRTIIGEVKRLPKGSQIGYDLTETLDKDSHIAICPVGYWHGYPRALSSVGHVIVGGKRVRVLGRVAMDMIVIDVTEIPRIKHGDEVLLIGAGKGVSVGADELGELACSVNYEIVTRINPKIHRFVV